MYNLDEIEDYEITIYGDIIEKKTRRYLTSYSTTTGDVFVKICGKRYRVAYLVAQKFLTNPNGLKQVHHTSFNSKDNDVRNLEWI